MGWKLRIGNVGGALTAYTEVVDLEFIDPLYEHGALIVALGDLGGAGMPVVGQVLRAVWDEGLASEQVHWEGYVTSAQKRENGLIVLRAFTWDGVLQINQTGTYRNYLTKSPHTIIQAAGTPNPLLVNDAATTVLTYGAAAGVPNKVDGGTPGVVLDQFVADSTTLLGNIMRLCLQARYGDGSYGLEWATRLEGANFSDPRFYLVKRRERSSGYTPETFNIPEDFVDARRGSDQAPGIDRVKVVGAGDGQSRITSPTVFIGSTREFTAEDKAIFQVTNATNMANRLLDIYGLNIESVLAHCYKHTHATRAGDTVTVTQTGVANANLRVIVRHYNLADRAFLFVVGRPLPLSRDNQMALASHVKTDTTTPQFTDKQSVAGDEPIAINGATVPVTAGNGVFGAWTTIHSFTPAAAFDCDYIDGLLTYYNNAANAHDADLNFRLIRNSDSLQFGTTFMGSARAPAPQDAMDTVANTAQVVIPINAILSTVQYDLQVQAKGIAVAFTDDFRVTGKIIKQHFHNEL